MSAQMVSLNPRALVADSPPMLRTSTRHAGSDVPANVMRDVGARHVMT